jgi:hypothetical protein
VAGLETDCSDVILFIQELRRQTGKAFRLPTHDEWTVAMTTNGTDIARPQLAPLSGAVLRPSTFRRNAWGVALPPAGIPEWIASPDLGCGLVAYLDPGIGHLRVHTSPTPRAGSHVAATVRLACDVDVLGLALARG